MNPETYDIYRKLGWTAEETWQFLIGATETDDGVEETEDVNY